MFKEFFIELFWYSDSSSSSFGFNNSSRFFITTTLLLFVLVSIKVVVEEEKEVISLIPVLCPKPWYDTIYYFILLTIIITIIISILKAKNFAQSFFYWKCWKYDGNLFLLLLSFVSLFIILLCSFCSCCSCCSSFSFSWSWFCCICSCCFFEKRRFAFLTISQNFFSRNVSVSSWLDPFSFFNFSSILKDFLDEMLQYSKLDYNSKFAEEEEQRNKA